MESKKLTPFQKASAIIPLAACKAAGIAVRGFRGRKSRSSGPIYADSITVGVEAHPVEVDVLYCWEADAVVVQYRRRPSLTPTTAEIYPEITKRFKLRISDEGEYTLVPEE